MAIIISGFPGIGKSYMFKNLTNKKIADSDSSLFSWKYVDGEKVRNEEFPDNYINHIKEIFNDYDYILVSTHKSVREALEKNVLGYTLIYPDINLKDEYIERYRSRKSPDSFIEMMDRSWESFINELDEDDFPVKAILSKNQTLYKLFGGEK